MFPSSPQCDSNQGAQSHSASKSALNGSRADEMTRYTASDSFACKYSVYEAKYPSLSKTHSNFVSIMKMRLERTGKKFVKRSPIMHRGYYARMEGQQMAIDRFLSQTESSHEIRQILYLGCGFDTAPIATYAHFKESDESQGSTSGGQSKKLKIFEVDFPDIINQKYEIYSTEHKIVKALATGEPRLDNELKYAASELHRGASSKLASDTIKEGTEEEEDGGAIDSHEHADSKPILHVEEKLHKMVFDTIGSIGHSSKHENDDNGNIFHTVHHLGALTLVSQDLRDANGLISTLSRSGFDPHKPTLIITECVLVYLNKEETDALCSILSNYFSHGRTVWVSYDMISPTDTYGQMMLKNLHKAGFSLPGFIEFPTLRSHEEKFHGPEGHDGHQLWSIAKSVDMLNFYNRVIDSKLIDEVNRLEILDEIEEWNMIMSHYCITVATNTELFHNIVESLTNLRPALPSPIKINPHAMHF